MAFGYTFLKEKDGEQISGSRDDIKRKLLQLHDHLQ